MFVIHGKRLVRVKKFTDNQHFCKSCGSPNHAVKIYSQYFHVFWIPFFPTGEKTSQVTCSACGEPFRNEAVQREFENKFRPPFYLYSGLILIGCLVVFVVIVNLLTQKEKAEFVANPKIGDVYTIRLNENKTTYYYFFQIIQVNGDTVVVCRNTLLYSRYVSKLNKDDFFTRENKLSVTKSGLKKMLDNGDINAVHRHYSGNDGFSRIQ